MVVLQNGWFMTGWFRGTPILGNPNINHYWIFLIIHTGWASEILHRLVDGKHPWKASHYIFTVFQESQKPLLIRLSLKIGYPNNLMIHHPFPRKKTCHLMGILIFRLAPNPCLTDAEIPMFDCWTDLDMSIFMMKSYEIIVVRVFSMAFYGFPMICPCFFRGFSWRHPPLISPPTSGFPPVTKVRVLCLKRPTSWPKQRWWLESLIDSISIYTHISTHMYIYIYCIYIYV